VGVNSKTGAVLQPWSNETVAKCARLAMWMALGMSIVVSVMVLLLSYVFLGQILQEEWERERTKTVSALSSLSASREEQKAMTLALGVKEERCNPFREPFRLLRVVLLKPVKKQLGSSLDQFVEEVCIRTKDTGAKNGSNAKLNDAESGASSATEFVYMRDFLVKYSVFCVLANEDTNLNDGAEAVKKRLVEKYNCRVTPMTVRRIHGLRWRREGEPSDALNNASVAAQTRHQLASNAAGNIHGAHDASTILRFLKSECKVSNGHDAWIDMETRPGPDGQILDGFRPRMSLFCKQNLLPTPNLRGDEWAAVLPATVSFVNSQRVNQIHGIRLPTKTSEYYMRDLTFVRVFTNGVGLLMDASFIAAPAILLCWHMLHSSDLLTTLNLVQDTPESQISWLSFRPTALPIFGTHDLDWVTALCIYESMAFMLISMVRAVDEYLLDPSYVQEHMSRVHGCWRMLYACILVTHSAFLTQTRSDRTHDLSCTALIGVHVCLRLWTVACFP
jgi:hypothetical protein